MPGFEGLTCDIQQSRVIFEPIEINKMVIELLIIFHHEDPDLFPVDVDNEDKIRNNYQYFRTFWERSDTRTLEKKASESDVDIVNRWKISNS